VHGIVVSSAERRSVWQINIVDVALRRMHPEKSPMFSCLSTCVGAHTGAPILPTDVRVTWHSSTS